MKYRIGTYKENEPDKTDFLAKIESKITLTREETQKYLIGKYPDGKCILEYKGERRDGVIMSMGTSGTYVIGILREEY
jgi:hypothetical protein